MKKQDAYAAAGVNIEAGKQAVALMKQAVAATYNENVLSDSSSFGGQFALTGISAESHPLLVASTDGVGTKTMVAAALNRWDTVGQDLVNHCINDILVQGARPLFFLDYVASSKLEPTKIATIVGGMAKACQAAGVVLLGGETAEMPGVYHDGAVDLVGTIVGMVDRKERLDGSTIEAGDCVLALPATGPHTNGYTLARRVLAEFDWEAPHDVLGMSIGDALLAVHRCYWDEVQTLKQAGVDIRGLAHITGGGVYDNLPRILPVGLGATIERGSWQETPIFGLLQRTGAISDVDMFHAFNMGLGMLVVVSEAQREQALNTLSELRAVGQIVVDADQQVVVR
ncbi:MAG: phosphoribosylformylglycinamidine cyclo-ligase [Candidatus Promineifilaceae bacterium]